MYPAIRACGFGYTHSDGVTTSFPKAFTRHDENSKAVDDLMAVLTELELYQGGNKKIPLSEVKELNALKERLEQFPHEDAVSFIREAQDSDIPLQDWFIYVMMSSSARNPTEARLLGEIKRNSS